ncbi:MAG: hypothetical protein JWO47_178 [Candidatus Saccharibacteria bacterium]|nr:hypothetical protein [Candidatus Saccharibacteria bacterium]
MQPEQTPPPTQSQPMIPQQSGQPENKKPPFYRQYWPFAVIFIVLPFGLIFGLLILFSGEVYRGKDSVYTPISQKEKTTLIIVGVILQLLGTLRVFS